VAANFSDQRHLYCQFFPVPSEPLLTFTGFFMDIIRPRLPPAMSALTFEHLQHAAVQCKGATDGELTYVDRLSDRMLEYVVVCTKMFFFVDELAAHGSASTPLESPTIGSNRDQLNKQLLSALRSDSFEDHHEARAERVGALLRAGADPSAKLGGERAESALKLAIMDGMGGNEEWACTKMVELLIRAQADVHAADQISGATALHDAAECGLTNIVRLLVEAGANPSTRDRGGKTAAERALESGRPTVVPLLDPALARREGEKLRQEFERASVVHVLSTRLRHTAREIEASQPSCLCEPREAARMVKEELEAASSGTKVFNPNEDNALLMTGDAESANAIWLLNWRRIGLKRAKETRGYCIQVIVQGGPSKMQDAEEDMANSEGVPVIRLRCDNIWDLQAEEGESARLRLLVRAVRVPLPSLEQIRQPRTVPCWKRIEISGPPGAGALVDDHMKPDQR
jgi:hypothetical protein